MSQENVELVRRIYTEALIDRDPKRLLDHFATPEIEYVDPPDDVDPGSRRGRTDDVAEVLVVSPNDTGIRQARAKTDRLDARTLARLWASGELDAVWMPNRATQVMRRRLQRRSQLV
jgi:hypothetical protein